MLPEGCKDCPACGVPMNYYGDACDNCIHNAAERLGIKVGKDEHGYTTYPDPKSGKDAYWRIAGLLARWKR